MNFIDQTLPENRSGYFIVKHKKFDSPGYICYPTYAAADAELERMAKNLPNIRNVMEIVERKGETE